MAYNVRLYTTFGAGYRTCEAMSPAPNVAERKLHKGVADCGFSEPSRAQRGVRIQSC